MVLSPGPGCELEIGSWRLEVRLGDQSLELKSRFLVVVEISESKEGGDFGVGITGPSPGWEQESQAGRRWGMMTGVGVLSLGRSPPVVQAHHHPLLLL